MNYSLRLSLSLSFSLSLSYAKGRKRQKWCLYPNRPHRPSFFFLPLLTVVLRPRASTKIPLFLPTRDAVFDTKLCHTQFVHFSSTEQIFSSIQNLDPRRSQRSQSKLFASSTLFCAGQQQKINALFNLEKREGEKEGEKERERGKEKKRSAFLHCVRLCVSAALFSLFISRLQR